MYKLGDRFEYETNIYELMQLSDGSVTVRIVVTGEVWLLYRRWKNSIFVSDTNNLTEQDMFDMIGESFSKFKKI